MLEVIGWIGAICFAICGLPQAIKCFRDKHADGLDWFFLILWFTGEICMLIYILPELLIPLIVNYFANLMFVMVIIYYKIFPQRQAIPQKVE